MNSDILPGGEVKLDCDIRTDAFMHTKTTRRQGGLEALRLRENVLAIVAHDLRTPLATITMAADLLTDERFAGKVDKFAQMIRAAAAQADALIKDLLDVARVEAGTLRIDIADEPIGYVVASAVASFELQAHTAGINLESETSRCANLNIPLDAGRLMQALSNLISNALKFTPQGGKVVVRAEVGESEVLISVADTGIGIEQDELQHVFERFWQAEHHHRAGAGLGLAICKGIVEAHGGRIWAESALNWGTTFTMALPLSPLPHYSQHLVLP